jgi:preprotein translocase subunit SecD
VGPSLGADSIRKGLIAIAGSAIVVFIFMLVITGSPGSWPTWRWA